MLLSAIETPVLMILEYFFVERLASSDSFTENKLILLNNVMTLVFVLGLLVGAIDLLAANTRKPNDPDTATERTHAIF